MGQREKTSFQQSKRAIRRHNQPPEKEKHTEEGLITKWEGSPWVEIISSIIEGLLIQHAE